MTEPTSGQSGGGDRAPDPPSPTRALPSLVEQGVLTGLIGAGVVAVWFLILDFARGAPLYTPSLLGSVLFLGASAEDFTGVNLVMVFAYTGLHVVLFLIAGVIIAGLVQQVERNPQFGLVLVLLFLLFESVVFGLEVTVVPALVGALGAVSVAVANLMSAIAMFWFLLSRRPEVLARLRESWEDED